MDPNGKLYPLTTGEHPTDAPIHLGITLDKKDRFDAYSAAALDAYHTLGRKGWRAIVPQVYSRSGQPVDTVLFRGGETSERSATKLTSAQRAALERLAIEHDLEVRNNLGDAIYKPPTAPEAGEEPSMLGGVQFAPSNEPGAIRMAAVRDRRTGKIFTASYHSAALDKAGKAGVAMPGSFDYGWVTNEGEFLSRRKAATRAEEMGQMTPGRAKFDALHSGDMDLQFSPAGKEEELALPGIGGKTPLSSARLGAMTKAEVAEYYPEAVIPKTWDEPIPSKVVESPLYKQSANEPEAVKAFADRLVQFAKQYQNHPLYLSGLRWYSDFIPKLKKLFGRDAPVFAELLAGTSPKQPPASNYAMALDAYQGWKSGRFDKQVKKFEAGLDKFKNNSWKRWLNAEIEAGRVEDPPATPTAETFVNHWVDTYDLLPRQSNGKLYSISSDAVLKVLARRWLDETSGLKTQNFVQNLLGIGHEATIDLWADRTMRRIGYSEDKPRWRILPKNASSVSDTDFRFSQAAFREAAKQLGLLPDALQGGLWFAEKQLWSDNGWGRLDLGDFRTEIKKTEMLKTGIEHRLAAQKAEAKAIPLAPQELFEPRPTRQ
jgi:hypothetical protein